MKHKGDFEHIVDFLTPRLQLDERQENLIFRLDISNAELIERKEQHKRMHYYEKQCNDNLFKFDIFYHQKDVFKAKTVIESEKNVPLLFYF